MSTQNPSKGTKVTTDPRGTENPIVESAGPVANDSLAADSTRAGGDFSKNRNSEPLGVSGSNSTFANTNISGATELPPAHDAESRLPGGENTSFDYPGQAGGQGKGVAVENTEFSSDSRLGGEGKGHGGVSKSDPAPTYVQSQYVKYPGGPKGQNLKEGGFDGDPKNNASFTAEIGSKDDPGRLAEEKFGRTNAGVDTSAGLPAKVGKTDKGSYEVLGGDTQA